MATIVANGLEVLVQRRDKQSGTKQRANCAGFTLVEILMVVLVIGLLTAIAVPAFQKARRKAFIANTANDLKVFSAAFDLYAMEQGGYPPDCHLDPPYNLPNTKMEEYMDAEKWSTTTPLGGNYNWEGPDSYPYAGISLFGATAGEDVMRQLDEVMDDGNLMTGMFRKIQANNRYTYILEE